jgi:hypothetical protein
LKQKRFLKSIDTHSVTAGTTSPIAKSISGDSLGGVSSTGNTQPAIIVFSVTVMLEIIIQMINN